MKKLMVANRGEIATRILRTARELGITTVAVYSDADSRMPFVREADEAFRLGPAESRLSYLNVDRLLEVAKEAGVDAIHPGYGFLSENGDFAERVETEGLTFIGPSSEAIRTMGDKVMARATVEKAKVPTVPGTGALSEPEEALATIQKLERERPDFKYPLLVKAAAGGGGKGMRVVRQASELREQIERAQSEALKAFGRKDVFVERYIENPRHIEVQVFGQKGSVVSFFERECSLQRRHQKVVEEALSPSISADLRKAICEAAVRAAETVDYRSAGTIEFIVSNSDDFYFLEMNTRIQVEHTVTEWVTSVDFIRSMIELAAGQSPSCLTEPPKPRGHAIQLRLYAEDAENQFLPQPGRLHFLRFPNWTGVRVDASVQSGSEVSAFYDPMVAKISAWAPDREQCRKRLIEFLKATSVEGLITNRAFLLDILQSEFFQKGRYSTHTLESLGWREPASVSAEALAALCLKDHLERGLKLETARPLSRWQDFGGWPS